MSLDEASSLLIREADPDNRGALVELLAAAGWSPAQLTEWLPTATVLEFYDPAFVVPRGAAMVRAAGEATFELLAWATDLDVDSADVAERLVRAIGDILRRNGAGRVFVPVTDASAERLAPLLAVGFRFASTRRRPPAANIELQPNGSDELVWLDQEL
jgi:hypothetical protein